MQEPMEKPANSATWAKLSVRASIVETLIAAWKKSSAARFVSSWAVPLALVSLLLAGAPLAKSVSPDRVSRFSPIALVTGSATDPQSHKL